MSKTTKVIVAAIVIYLIVKKNPHTGETLGNAAQDYWIASAALSVF